jgi:hypothetical protein
MSLLINILLSYGPNFHGNFCFQINFEDIEMKLGIIVYNDELQIKFQFHYYWLIFDRVMALGLVCWVGGSFSPVRGRHLFALCLPIFIWCLVHCCAIPLDPLIFSSPELKAQVSFSDRLLSFVGLSVCLLNIYIFDFFRTTGPILTRLGTKHPWAKGIQIVQMKDNPLPQGEIIAKE